MNGLNRSPSASSNERPGGLAQTSHAAASMLAMDGTTRAVKAEDMGGQAVRSGGIAYPSTLRALFMVKGPQTSCEARIVAEPATQPATVGARSAEALLQPYLGSGI